MPVDAALTVRVAVLVTFWYVAERVTVVVVETVPLVMGNWAEVAPAATVTLAGTLAAELLELLSATTAPPEGAAAVRVTVPAVEETASEASAAGAAAAVTVRVAVLLTPP